MLRRNFLCICGFLGFFSIARWMTRNRLRILGYHGIWFSNGHYGNHLFMGASKFESRMKWLKNSSYNVISLDQAVSNLIRADLPPYSTVITIDDGWYGTYRDMLPILEKYNLPASLYVYTGPVDSQKALPNILLPALLALTQKKFIRFNNSRYISDTELDLSSHLAKSESTQKILNIFWGLENYEIEDFCHFISNELGFDYAQILKSRQFSFMSYEEITDANMRGLDIQLHSDSHKLDTNLPEGIVKEIVSNREKLRPHVHSSLEHFCYPSGLYSSEMFNYLRLNNVKSATLIETGLVYNDSNLYELKRILDGQEISQVEFEAEMSGFMELIRDLKNKINNLFKPSH